MAGVKKVKPAELDKMKEGEKKGEAEGSVREEKPGKTEEKKPGIKKEDEMEKSEKRKVEVTVQEKKEKGESAEEGEKQVEDKYTKSAGEWLKDWEGLEVFKLWLAVVKKNWVVFAGVAVLTVVLVGLGLRTWMRKGEELKKREIKTTYDKPAEGQSAPDFSLEAVNGEKISLSELEDKKVLVVLLSTWHPLGQDALKILETIYKKQRSFVIVVIAVQQEKEVVADYLRRGAYSLSVYLDTTGEVGEKYQVTSMPSFYFIDSKGKFKKVFVGPLTREEILEAGRTL